MLLSQLISLPPSRPRSALYPQSLLYVCVSIAALQIGSSVSSFQIPYACINMHYLTVFKVEG